MKPVTIRDATRDDIETIAQIQTEGWRDSYRGIMPDALLDGPLLESHVRLWTRIFDAGSEPEPFLAEADGHAAGFLSAGSVRGSNLDYDVEVYAIYIRSAYRRRGVGLRLMAHTARTALARGKRTLMLWTLEANNRARRFYTGLGGAAVGREIHRFDGISLPEIAYGWDHIETLRDATDERLRAGR